MRILRWLNVLLLLTGLYGCVTLRAQDNGTSTRLPSSADVTCSSPSARCVQEWAGFRTAEGRSQALVLHFGASGSQEKPTVDLPDFGALGTPAAKFRTVVSAGVKIPKSPIENSPLCGGVRTAPDGGAELIRSVEVNHIEEMRRQGLSLTGSRR